MAESVEIWHVSEPDKWNAYFTGPQAKIAAHDYARALAKVVHDGAQEEYGIMGTGGGGVVKAKDGAEFHIRRAYAHESAASALIAYGER